METPLLRILKLYDEIFRRVKISRRPDFLSVSVVRNAIHTIGLARIGKKEV